MEEFGYTMNVAEHFVKEASKTADIYKKRRKALVDVVLKNDAQKGIIILFSNFEMGEHAFKQEGSFFYYTGIQEPGYVLVLDAQNEEVYLPSYGSSRADWLGFNPDMSDSFITKVRGFSAVKKLGNPVHGCHFSPAFHESDCAHIIQKIKEIIALDGIIYTPLSKNRHQYVQQQLIIDRLASMVSMLREHIEDISGPIAAARRCKDAYELSALSDAIAVTHQMQQLVASKIADGVSEYELTLMVDIALKGAGLTHAFPMIVAAGENGTVLHYSSANGWLRNGDLVVVDMGVRLGNYCADITRTYPVSGQFTARQRKIYQLVLDTQEYIATIAKPGMWINNKEKPSESLQHCAKEFLNKAGFDEFFTHGIGHFLGIDVHDVGDYTVPLQEGDVITIEPGIYLPKERFGIRIEDNYVITSTGSDCLSAALPKTIESVEKMVGNVDFD